MFLELGSYPIQFPCFGVRVAEGAVRPGEAEGIIFRGLNGGRRERKKEREKENGWK
jgi:hypothetical protein